MTTREDEMVELRAKVVAELSYGLAHFADVQITGTAEKAIADRIVTTLSSEREILRERAMQCFDIYVRRLRVEKRLSTKRMNEDRELFRAALTGVKGG